MSGLLNDRNSGAASAALERAAGREPDFIARALETVRAVTSDQKAWSLVRLAADLRAAGRPAMALQVLDTAFFLAHEPETERAMFSSAVGAHCDLGQHAIGKVVERDWVKHGEPDVKFANAALRLYSHLVQETGDPGDERLRAHYGALVSD